MKSSDRISRKTRIFLKINKLLVWHICCDILVSDITDQSEVSLSEGHAPGMSKSDAVIQMIKATDKRTEKRHACDTKLKWTPLNRIAFNHGQEIFNCARALNFSNSGLYLETKYRLKPGMTIFVRVEESICGVSNLQDCDCLRTISFADVKWCQKLVKNGESYFGIGAKYLVHY